jgi:hypothetical protein
MPFSGLLSRVCLKKEREMDIPLALRTYCTVFRSDPQVAVLIPYHISYRSQACDACVVSSSLATFANEKRPPFFRRRGAEITCLDPMESPSLQSKQIGIKVTVSGHFTTECDVL